jgi:hypothetical protein
MLFNTNSGFNDWKRFFFFCGWPFCFDWYGMDCVVITFLFVAGNDEAKSKSDFRHLLLGLDI